VATSTVREVARQGRLLTLLNRREISARRGMIVSGPQTTGKTTALKELGRLHELRVRACYPGSDRIPVVYVTTPPKGSPRKLAMEFARFLGLPPARRNANATGIADTVCGVLIDARVDLVLVEIHNLNLATSAGEDMSDHRKYFTEHLPATFVYAGWPDWCAMRMWVRRWWAGRWGVGWGQEEALGLVAACGGQHGELGGVFDAFGDDGQPVGVGGVDE